MIINNLLLISDYNSFLNLVNEKKIYTYFTINYKMS